MVARQYVKEAPDGRDPGCAVLTLAQGAEPALFTCHFDGWDAVAAAACEDPYTKALAEHAEESGVQEAAFHRELPSASELLQRLELEGVAPESEVRQMVVAFEYYDMDGGGFIDADEFRKLAPTLLEQGLMRKGAERASDLADAFASIDLDNSGFVDLEEFVGWWFRDKTAMKAKLEARNRPPLASREVPEIKARLGIMRVPDGQVAAVKEVWMRSDREGNGLVDKNEFRLMAPELGVNLTPNGMRKAFELLDADGSGTVEFEEFVKWHFAEKVRQLRPPPVQ
jgi:Ca2+-binding EF-hand superfamily protein